MGSSQEEPVPLGLTKSIPVLEKHYIQFGHKHPLEFEKAWNSDDGKWRCFHKRREIFVADKKELFNGEIAIDVTGIKRALSARKLRFGMYQGNLNQGWVDYILQYGGCEEEHIAALSPASLRRPGIMIAWTPDGNNTTLVDGNHRLVRKWREGFTTFDYALVVAPDIVSFLAKPERCMEKFIKNDETFEEKLRDAG